MPSRGHRARAGHRPHTFAVIAALAGAVGILAFVIIGSTVAPPSAPGVVQMTEIKIASEISGRLAHIAVAAGSTVRRGDELALLSNPELQAALVLAKAQLAAAQAASDRVYAGVRVEEVKALQHEIDLDKANLLYTEQELARKSQLAATQVASAQELDQATAAVTAARAKVANAQAAYLAASLGATPEELAIADTKLEDAAAAVAVVAARVDKLRITAPADGTVALLVAEQGEAINPGQTLMTLEAAGRSWASFNLREDQFGGLHLGSPVRLVPADGGRAIDAKIAEIVPRGEFATWRATRAVGDHDLNGFVLRADPVAATPDTLRPGMTVWLEPAAPSGN
jgi:HlyD family secretion protein